MLAPVHPPLADRLYVPKSVQHSFGHVPPDGPTSGSKHLYLACHLRHPEHGQLISSIPLRIAPPNASPDPRLRSAYQQHPYRAMRPVPAPLLHEHTYLLPQRHASTRLPRAYLSFCPATEWPADAHRGLGLLLRQAMPALPVDLSNRPKNAQRPFALCHYPSSSSGTSASLSLLPNLPLASWRQPH